MEQTQTPSRIRELTSTYPVVLTNLGRMRCVVVGGGRVSERKVHGLLDAGARPHIISPTLTPKLAQWRDEALISHTNRAYADGDLVGAWLVIAATDDAEVNANIAHDAGDYAVLVNIADAPELGNFHTVSTVRHHDFLLTVSTNGASPTLASLVKSELANQYGTEYGELTTKLKLLRDELKQYSTTERTAIIKQLLGR